MKKRGKNKKKGVSVLISWVLMIGFVVGLAATVTVWMTKYVRELTNQTFSKEEQKVYCQDIKFAVSCTISGNSVSVKITNKGGLNIYGADIRLKNADGRMIGGGENSDLIQVGQPPKEFTFTETGVEKAEVIPLGQGFNCGKEKRVTVDCSPQSP